jgi:hypothetical protein
MTGSRYDRPGGTGFPARELPGADDVVGVLSGTFPPGAGRPRDVPLYEGDRYLIGRPGRPRVPPAAGPGRFLSLGPGVRRTVPAVALVLAVARSAVHIGAGHGAVHLLVDGVVPAVDGMRLAGPAHGIVVAPAWWRCWNVTA